MHIYNTHETAVHESVHSIRVVIQEPSIRLLVSSPALTLEVEAGGVASGHGG